MVGDLNEGLLFRPYNRRFSWGASGSDFPGFRNDRCEGDNFMWWAHMAPDSRRTEDSTFFSLKMN